MVAQGRSIDETAISAALCVSLRSLRYGFVLTQSTQRDAEGRREKLILYIWTLLWRASQPQHHWNLLTNRSRHYFASMRNGFTSRLTKHLSLFAETRSTSRSVMNGSCYRAGPRRELGGGEFTRGNGPG